MRYLILWFGGSAVIYAGFYLTYTGPVFAIYVQPLLSSFISGVVLLLAIVAGLPTRWHVTYHMWHITAVGALTSFAAIVAGWIAIVAAFSATPRATVSNAILVLCGLLAIDFGVINWPKPRKA